MLFQFRDEFGRSPPVDLHDDFRWQFMPIRVAHRMPGDMGHLVCRGEQMPHPGIPGSRSADDGNAERRIHARSHREVFIYLHYTPVTRGRRFVPRLFTPTTVVAFVLAGASAILLVIRADAPSLVPSDLPSTDRQLVELLLLLPVAALVCCVARVVVGLHTYGTFAPALLGLSFREVGSVAGIFVLVVVLSVGWLARRGLARLNLLQVPRSAVMLCLVVTVLLIYVLYSNARGRSVAGVIPFVPLVIVTGLIERFWTTEEEDGTATAVRTMAATLVMSATVFVVVRWEVVSRSIIAHPEALGLIAAAQMLLGRYTGYRLSELYRFRDLA